MLEVSSAGPLAGIRVLELGAALAGPWCGHVLSTLGADVIKVEPLLGDESRAGGPPFWGGEAPLFLAANGNKRSIALDLRQAKGREIVAGIAGRVDVVVQNLRPGAVDRLGLGFDAIRRINDRIVYCNLSGFGHEGPLKDATAYDALIQGVTGIMSATRDSADSPPLRTGPAIIDLGTGLWAAIGILAALRARDRDNAAQRVDTSLFETGVNWQPMQILSYLADGVVPPPPGRSSIIYAPFQAFDTSDGTIVVGAGNTRLFATLVDALACPELAEDPRYGTNADRVIHREELAAALAAKIGERSTSHWIERFRAVGLPVGQIQDVGDLVRDPQLEALGLLQDVPHDEIADLRLVAPPLTFNGARPRFRSAPPALGQHTTELLTEMGFTAEDIDELVSDRIVSDGLSRRR